MKNKSLIITLVTVILLQLLLTISPPLYESAVFSLCESYGKEYKLYIPSMQIDIFDRQYREDRIYIDIRNNYENLSIAGNNIGFMLNEEGFCVFDLYGTNAESCVATVKKEFLYGRSYPESELTFSDGVTPEAIVEYLDTKGGNKYRLDGYDSGYYSFDFSEGYGPQVYVTVKVYAGVMIKKALYIDGEKAFEFKE